MNAYAMFLVMVLMCSSVVDVRAQNQECNEQRVRRMIASPAESWSINKMTRSDINDFICSRQLVKAAVSCLEDPDIQECQSVDGLYDLVDTITRQMNRDYSCDNCDAKTMNLLQHAVKTVQKRFPREYNRGLASFY